MEEDKKETTNTKEKIVYLALTGDLIHPGIINIIQKGSTYGKLIVGLLTDGAIANHRRLPYLTFEQRRNVVENVKGVSQVIPQEEWDYIPTLRKLKPDYLIHGDDWKENDLKLIRENCFEVMKEWGGEIIEIPFTKGIDKRHFRTNSKIIGTTPEIRLKSLRRLLAAKPILRIMEAHSGLSGSIVEHLEIPGVDEVKRFDGIWSSSLTDSTVRGKPDIEVVDLTTRLQSLTDILECTTKPIIYDGDTGDIKEHFVFTVKTLERNGISAVIIEDKKGLKKNSLFGTEVKQELASEEEFCEKIKAGKEAQITNDFMIIARIEEIIAGRTIDEALKKAFACVSAGADGIMIHSKEKTGMDIKEFCQKFRLKFKDIPLILVPTTYNQFTENEFKEWGANIIIYANHMLRSSYPAMLKTAECILKNGRSLEANELCMPIKQILNLVPGTK